MVHQSIIGNIKPQTKIYRIFPRKRFFELFEERKNALVRPKKWNDPFENIFLNSPVKNTNGENGSFDFHDDVYAQCWTLETASDAMWQIYSREEDAIRLRTTVEKLICSMRAVHGNWADACCFIGRIKYHTESELREFGKSMFIDYFGAEAIARSLLIKRKAYKYENEVRLIYIAPNKTKDSDYVYKYKVDPLKVFDQAMIDGRVSKEEFDTFKNEVVKRTGLRKERIKRSVLYSQPKGFVVRIP